MRIKRICVIAGVFGFFQAFMPMAGWVCIKTVISIFSAFEKLVPWIALILLLFIGGKMIIEGIKSRSANCSRIATAPLEISRFRNISKPRVVKKSGMLCFQDWISYSNERIRLKQSRIVYIA